MFICMDACLCLLELLIEYTYGDLEKSNIPFSYMFCKNAYRGTKPGGSFG